MAIVQSLRRGWLDERQIYAKAQGRGDRVARLVEQALAQQAPAVHV